MMESAHVLMAHIELGLPAGFVNKINSIALRLRIVETALIIALSAQIRLLALHVNLTITLLIISASLISMILNLDIRNSAKTLS